jgi:hypothetical protein
MYVSSAFIFKNLLVTNMIALSGIDRFMVASIIKQ